MAIRNEGSLGTGKLTMTQTIPENAGNPAAARSRLIYIGERLKELRNERDRLIEERASLKAAIAASKGERQAGPRQRRLGAGQGLEGG